MTGEEMMEKELTDIRDSNHVVNIKSREPGVFHAKYDILRIAHPMVYAALKDIKPDDQDVEAKTEFLRALCEVCIKGFGKGSWLESGMGRVAGALDKLPKEWRDEFTRNFFLAFMDILWHAQKSVPVDDARPPVLEEALSICLALRRMTPEMRKDYLEHLWSHNAEPAILK